jgi:hypothetical protein
VLQRDARAARPASLARVPSAQAPGSERWLMLVHQLPAHPSNLRVRTWRRLQQIGAIAVKQAVYLLPNAPGAREDFEWLRTEIEGAGGEAAVFAANAVDAWTGDTIVNEFLRTRETAYATLAQDADACLRRLDRKPPRRKDVPSARLLHQLQERLAAIERIDFFGSAGRDRVASLLKQITERVRGAPASADRGEAPLAAYQGRLWVTRPRPGVDRMASAWLIRRFVDANARFDFAPDRKAVPEGAVPFDMYGVEFTHRGEHCTFEVLCATFHVEGPAVAVIGQIVHDLDLKDGRFGRQEAAAIALAIEGLQLSRADDHDLLAQGMTLFEALYLALSQADRASRPRAVATRRSSGQRGRRR